MGMTRRKSQNQQILEALQKGDAITPMSALARFNCFRLATRIFELKAQGHDIVTNLVKHGDKTFAEYRMAS